MVPAWAVGGDFFDFISLGPETIGIVVGDVSGKGLGAAIFMALARSLLRAEASRAATPREALASVNRHLLDMNDKAMFVTVLYGLLHRATRDFSYARAGHEMPLLLDAQGTPLALARGRGQPLGILPTPLLDEQTAGLPPGGMLLLYTDGVTEAAGPEGTLFGMDRLRKAVRAFRTASAQAICDQLLQTVAQYGGPAPQGDDITLVAVQAR